MKLSRFAIAAALLLFGAASLNSQTREDIYARGLGGDLERTAGVYHSYEAVEGPLTAAPSGYKAFYVSHYGRHGSRRQIGSSGTEAYRYLSEASKAGALTPLGERLLKDVTAVYECHVGMDGELTIRGGYEHRGIAERMYGRFKEAFRDRDRTVVHCQASIIPRCLISMANFTYSLKSKAPALQFDFITGQKYIDLLAQDFYDRDSYRKRQNEINDSLLKAYVDPSRIMKAFFKDPSVIDNPRRFMRYLFALASDCQDLREELDGLSLYGYFTEDELIGLGRYFNERTYSSFGNSAEFGDNVIWAAKPLVEDFISRADAAVAGNDVAADLRFGHDSGLLPLAGLLGLEDLSSRYHVGEAWQNGYFIWESIPMGSNLQMIFYRGRGNDVIVKILYNEKERRIPALDERIRAAGGRLPEGPFYRWDDLRGYLVSISENKELGK